MGGGVVEGKVLVLIVFAGRAEEAAAIGLLV